MRHRPRAKSRWQKLTGRADKAITGNICAASMRYRNQTFTWEKKDGQLVVGPGYFGDTRAAQPKLDAMLQLVRMTEKLGLYELTEGDHDWLNMEPVGKEWGSEDET